MRGQIRGALSAKELIALLRMRMLVLDQIFPDQCHLSLKRRRLGKITRWQELEVPRVPASMKECSSNPLYRRWE